MATVETTGDGMRAAAFHAAGSGRSLLSAGGRPFLLIIIIALATGYAAAARADYRETTPAPPPAGAVEVSSPGVYARPGVEYWAVRDISSETGALYLGNDVTLDLNGHTVTFADGGYGHIPNYGFEKGLEGWDTTRARGAVVESTDSVHVFIGKRILRLSRGDEIVSSSVMLPVGGRSYFAMCGVAVTGMKISLFVETADGETVVCHAADGERICCPVENKTVRLGGGFVTAHMHGMPAGRYRVRVRAETDCLVDHIDLRPAMDVGIGIIGATHPDTHTDDFFEGKRCAFFDEAHGPGNRHAGDIPRVSGPGTVTIRNGVIRCGARSIMSWGIQSTAEDCRIVLENIRIVNSGINANAVDVPFGEVRNCRFEVDTPFIINRHASEHAVVMRGAAPSEIAGSVFLGGQGCLTVRGNGSRVHDNLFVNRQTVTNHYCVMVAADSVKVFDNRFEPETGSGLEIYVHKYNEIFDNVFRITASPPTCEYGHEDYSVNGIRVADYRAEPGSPHGCEGNRIYGNTFHIVGKDYPEYPDYIPMAYGVFHSVSGGDTYYHDNVFHVDHRSPGTKAEAAACYISGNNAGQWHDNVIVTNTHAFWIGSRYGDAHNGDIAGNTIVKAAGSPPGFRPVRMGWAGREGIVAGDIAFRSNEFIGSAFSIDEEGSGHEYAVYWTLTVRTVDGAGRVLADTTVTVSDASGQPVARGGTGGDGRVSFELPEYTVDGETKTCMGEYTVTAGAASHRVTLTKNTEITVRCEH